MVESNLLLSRWNTLDAARSTTKTLVQEVMDYCLPRRAAVIVQRTEGQNLHKDLTDSTAEISAERGASGLYGAMCPSDRAWFMLTPPIEYGRLAGEFGRDMLGVSEAMRDHVSRSNYAEAAYEGFLDLMTAGLCTVETNRGVDSLFEYTAYPFEQVTFEENSRGRVDAVYRRFGWSARQIVQEFGRGEAAVGKSIWDAYSANDGRDREKLFEVVHAAIPRQEYPGGRLDALNMPVASVWIAVTDRVVLRESGWPQLRYLVCRWVKASGEKHGRSPAMTCLPDIKMINRMEDSIIEGAEQVVRPTILNPDGAALISNSRDASGKPIVIFRPGSILNYRLNAIAPGVKPEPFATGARVDFGQEYAESKRRIIRAAMFNDLFMVLMDQTHAKTATEVRAILHDQMRLLGPQFGRMKVEFFDALIRINLSIMSEVPQLLGGIPLELLNLANIRYTSTLALAMEYAEMTAMQDAMVFLSPFAEIDPTVWDNFSFDEISRGIAEKMALPPRWLKPRDEVRALREARMQVQAQQMQQAMAMQQAEQMARVTQKPEPGSPAEAVMRGAA